MSTLFAICAVVGGTILVCQFVLTLTGLSGADDLSDDVSVEIHDLGHGADHGHDHHQNHGHGSNWFFGVISFRTVTAACTFFGLAGLASTASGFERLVSLAIAATAGLSSMYFVHWMMRSLALLRAEGTVRIGQAVGAEGTVYIKIPGRRSGQGKVQVALQGQTVELSALTECETLPTGARIVVTKVLGGDAVEVAPLAETH